MKDEFKMFVRTKPELIKYVNSGDMTWQKFYEMWSLYGVDEKVWDKYKANEDKQVNQESKDEAFTFSSLVDSIKKVDMNSVQKGIGSVQKAIELLQGFTSKDVSVTDAASYKPRQLFKKFED